MADAPNPTTSKVACNFIADLRGGVPKACGFCRMPFGKGRYPIPEEAGEWACNECVARWEAK